MEHNAIVPASDLLKFIMKLQQYTAPVMAKGYEDTALYQYNRLISLNEVGGDLRQTGNSVNAFHHFNQERIKKWPHSMLCLSSHDTKHSADVRARINVLSEIPERWQEAVLRWRRLKDFTEFEKQIRKPGLYNALAQTVLHLTSPGVPDIYQGSELWQFALVDPDNRRPVDFSKNRQLLNEMDAMLAKPDVDRPLFIRSLLENIEDGRIKLFIRFCRKYS
jgi:maltooligosyltrehalose synthase